LSAIFSTCCSAVSESQHPAKGSGNPPRLSIPDGRGGSVMSESEWG
jgi:hypothetical protein